MGVVCQILIDRPSEGVHRAGGPVSGVVKYAIDRSTEYKDIVLSLQGESWCSWSESDSDDQSTTSYTGTEAHVSQVVSILNPTKVPRTLPAGAYEHSFFFTLPKAIPPTYKLPTGHVSYKVLLEFKKQAIFNATKSFKAEINVLNYLDPTLPDTPIVFGVDTTLFKPLSIGKHKIQLKAEIATPYIKPGEKAELKVTLVNDSTTNVKCLRAELVRCTIFTAEGGRTASEVKRIKNCTVETGEVRSHSTATMDISVPATAQERTVQHSKVISNEYRIQVTVRLPVPHRNATAMVPVLLGDREDIQGLNINGLWNAQPPSWHMDQCKD